MSAIAPKLAVLVKRFPKLSETFILAEIIGLERMGFEVTIFSLHRPSDEFSQPANAEVRARVVYLDCKHGAVADLECALRIASHLRTHGIPHLHAHFVDRPAGIAALTARFADITFSLSAHAKDIYLSDPAVLEKRMRHAAFTATCTDYNRAALLKMAPGARVHRIYHGIDTHQFSGKCANVSRGQGARILAVGRLRAKKGFSTLIQACALLPEQGVLDVCCDIVGYGEQHDVLREQIESLGLSGRVRLLGKMDHTALIELYRDSAVFAAPCEIAPDGDRDGIPNVLLEAMAMELPIVSTPVSGIVEVVTDGLNGLLVPPGEPQALAQALGRLLASSALRAQLGERARRSVVEKFGAQSNLPELAALLAPYTSYARRQHCESQHVVAGSSRDIGYANV